MMSVHIAHHLANAYQDRCTNCSGKRVAGNKAGQTKQQHNVVFLTCVQLGALLCRFTHN